MSSCAGDNVDSRREPAVHAPSALKGKRGLKQGLTSHGEPHGHLQFYHATSVRNTHMPGPHQWQSILKVAIVYTVS